MNISLDDIVSKSKERLANTYFKIVKNGDEYEIQQYIGLKKSPQTMMYEGWYVFTSLLDYINRDYPVFDINDFKCEDGAAIIKKDENDRLKSSFKEVIEYFTMNRSLFGAFSDLKNFLQKLSVDFMKFNDFEKLIEFVKNYIDSLSLPTSDKAVLLFEFTNIRIKIFEEMEMMNIEHPVSLLNEKFKCFLMVVK